MTLSLLPLFKGFSIGLGLIVAIGMQSSFVLKQGILKNHIFVIALICSLIDTILIIAGVNGLGTIFTSHYLLLETTRWAGVIFLTCYSIRSFYLAFKKHNSLQVENKAKLISLKQAILTSLAVSLLNPHVYIDSCILLGSISAQMDVCERPSFATGAVFASFCWFFTLGYGARLLRPLFEKPLAWKILDFIIGCVMLTIAVSLIYSF